jgi:hypothetical protein
MDDCLPEETSGVASRWETERGPFAPKNLGLDAKCLSWRQRRTLEGNKAGRGRSSLDLAPGINGKEIKAHEALSI